MQSRMRLCVMMGVLAFLLAACTSATGALVAEIPDLARTHVLTPGKLTSTHIVAGDWSAYLSNNGRSGFNQAESTINPTTAPTLTQHWVYHAKSYISTQPVEAFGRIYWGSWDGLEHATDLNGNEAWATKLGTTHGCSGIIGVASTAAAASVTIRGVATPVVLVAGGNSHFYALDAANGTIIWNTPLGSPPNHFIWSSPILYKGSIYVGMASFGDCPGVQGQLIQMNVATGAVEHIFNVVPKGCIGGGVWSSPAIDNETGELYFVTGNPDKCATAEPYATAIIELHASNLKVVSVWQIPPSQRITDSDFGSAPTLFTASIKGVSHALVGIAHKNGMYYALMRGAISKGPVWIAQIAKGGSCPNCGGGSISPSAWDGTRLYVAGGSTTINGVKCRGSLRALNPASGTFFWESCLSDGPVLAAVTVVPGVVVVTGGSAVTVADASSGKTLFVYKESIKGSVFFAAASISNGMMYVGSFLGNLYAFGV